MKCSVYALFSKSGLYTLFTILELLKLPKIAQNLDLHSALLCFFSDGKNGRDPCRSCNFSLRGSADQK